MYSKTVKKIAVLDRTKEPGSIRRTFIFRCIKHYFIIQKMNPIIVGGRYGLRLKGYNSISNNSCI